MLIVQYFWQRYECCGIFNCDRRLFINGEVLVQSSKFKVQSSRLFVETLHENVSTRNKRNCCLLPIACCLKKCTFAAELEVMGKRKQDNKIEIKNRKAEFLYYLHTSYTAGIVLTGTEIKSIRAGRANITDA